MRLTTVFRVTLVYLVFGLLWIIFSDKLLDLLFINNPVLLSKFQTIKGSFYVGCTSVLLYFLVKSYSTELNQKIAGLEESEQQLIKSEEKYRTLFESSPMPVFIYQPETDRILDVNKAAVSHYGYTRNEFSTMSLLEQEDEADVELLEAKLNIPQHNSTAHSTGIHRHKKKSGELIYVFTQGTDIHYKGDKAQIVIANDITQQLKYIDAIEKQNGNNHQNNYRRYFHRTAPWVHAQLSFYCSLLLAVSSSTQQLATLHDYSICSPFCPVHVPCTLASPHSLVPTARPAISTGNHLPDARAEIQRK